jgi:hypothetical protein
MKSYIVAGGDTPAELEIAVNRLIGQGYKPQGGVTRSPRGMAYIQAMVLESRPQRFTRSTAYERKQAAIIEECGATDDH